MKYMKNILILLMIMAAVSSATIQYSFAALPAGSRPPAFIGSANDWINSPPLTWQQLKGKVVLVGFPIAGDYCFLILAVARIAACPNGYIIYIKEHSGVKKYAAVIRPGVSAH